MTGVDDSQASIEEARRSTSSSAINFALASEFAARDAFDVVYVNGVFHHVPATEQPGALAAMVSALRPGGVLALWENNPYNPGTRWVMRRLPFDRDAVMLRPSLTRRLVEEAGLTVLATDYCFFFPRPLASIRPLERSPAISALGRVCSSCRATARLGAAGGDGARRSPGVSSFHHGAAGAGCHLASNSLGAVTAGRPCHALAVRLAGANHGGSHRHGPHRPSVGLDRRARCRPRRARRWVAPARNLAGGRWRGPTLQEPAAFEQMHVFGEPGVASKSPPFHSAVLVPGVWLSRPGLMPVVLSGVATGLFFALARNALGGWVALASTCLLMTSQPNLFWRSTYFSETTTSALWLGVVWCVLSGKAARDGGCWRSLPSVLRSWA